MYKTLDGTFGQCFDIFHHNILLYNRSYKELQNEQRNLGKNSGKIKNTGKFRNKYFSVHRAGRAQPLIVCDPL